MVKANAAERDPPEAVEGTDSRINSPPTLGPHAGAQRSDALNLSHWVHIGLMFNLAPLAHPSTGRIAASLVVNCWAIKPPRTSHPWETA